MLSPDRWELLLSLLLALLYGVLFARLWASGLLRAYPRCGAFALFLFCQGLIALAPSLAVQLRSNFYAWFYFTTQPVVWFLYLLVIIELYNSVWRDYPGLAFLSRWAVRLVLPSAVGIVLLVSLPGLHAPTGRYPVLQLFILVERTVMLSLLVFLVLLWLIVLRYPVAMNRNTVTYLLGYGLFFAVRAIGLLLITEMGLQIRPWANILMEGISCACLGYWAVALGPAGEQKVVTLAPGWRPGEQQELRRQLQSVNTVLLKLARK